MERPDLEVADPPTTSVQPPLSIHWPQVLAKLVVALLGLLVFILALQLIKEGARGYGRSIIRLLDIQTPTNALGFGWLLAYLFLSGSPVAAIAVSFFAGGTISNLQAFAMITGSRLGASFIVLFVGFVYYLRGQQRSASVAIGVLALLTTAAIYLPALPIGYVLLTSNWLGVPDVAATAPLASFLDWLYDPLLARIQAIGIPGWVELLLGVATLLAAFSLLDRALPEMHAERSAFRRIGQLIYRPAAMFILGMAVTSVTMSVSVSLSILVPLAARGMVRRENTVPYIMGANITTFIDTLVAALVTGGPPAFMIVFVEMASVALLSVLVLVCCYRPFERLLLHVQEVVIRSHTSLAAFVAIMLIIPLILLMVN